MAEAAPTPGAAGRLHPRSTQAAADRAVAIGGPWRAGAARWTLGGEGDLPGRRVMDLGWLSMDLGWLSTIGSQGPVDLGWGIMGTQGGYTWTLGGNGVDLGWTI